MKKILLLVWVLGISMASFAQGDTTETGKKIKKGLVLGPLPVIAFDSDLGVQYGALVNLYFYGDGSTYPKYKHLIFAEGAYSTKGSGIFRLFYDSDQILAKKNKYLRLSLDLSYLMESGLGFYGFNGFETNYNTAFETTGDKDYITRMYYRHQRHMFRAQADVQGRIIGKKLRWVFGLAHMNFNIETVDVDRLNEGKDSDLLPDTNTLYDNYVRYGLINSQEANGGMLNMIKGGIVWDTRDLEANPNKGLWDEIVFYTFPKFMDNHENTFTGFTVIHRQYITLVKRRLTFAYRLGYKGVIAGDMPFYFDPYMVTSYSLTANREGLGGASTFRGMKRNRVVGDGFGWGNFCLRYKFWYFSFFNSPSYLALNGFVDMGQVFQPRDIDRSLIPANEQDDYFNASADHMHYSFGGGIHFAMNENFVVRLNYGKVLDAQDGTSSIYITTNWVF
jgi:hypothetical protein